MPLILPHTVSRGPNKTPDCDPILQDFGAIATAVNYKFHFRSTQLLSYSLHLLERFFLPHFG